MATEYPITIDTLEAMLSVTRIDSPIMRQALHDHFVLNHAQSAAAARYGISKQHFGVQVRNIRDKIKPAFDAYADSVLKLKG